METQQKSPKSTINELSFKENIHYSKELEAAILGACIIENTAFGRVYGVLTEDCFYYEANKTVFEYLSKMWKQGLPIDHITLFLKLTSEGIAELAGSNTGYYLTKISRDVTSAAHLEYHALILRQMFVERRILILTHGGLKLEGDGLEQMRTIQAEINSLREVHATNDFKGIDEAVLGLMAHMDKVKDSEIIGVPTGFKVLDKMTSGFQPTQMIIIGARPSVGKTAFMGSLVLNAARAGFKVGVISLEMNNDQITARLAAITTETDFWRIHRNRLIDEEQTSIFYNLLQTRLSKLPIYLSDSTAVNIHDIKAKVSRLKAQGKIDIIFIDYLQLVDTETGGNKSYNREQEVSKISRGIKLMALEFNIPAVVLCQLNRKAEERGDKKPKLSDLRESGSLEQDADGVILLHRDWVSGIKADEKGCSTENTGTLIISKWRNGETGEMELAYDGAKMKFSEPVSFQSGWRPVTND